MSSIERRIHNKLRTNLELILRAYQSWKDGNVDPAEFIAVHSLLNEINELILQVPKIQTALSYMDTSPEEFQQIMAEVTELVFLTKNPDSFCWLIENQIYEYNFSKRYYLKSKLALEGFMAISEVLPNAGIDVVKWFETNVSKEFSKET